MSILDIYETLEYRGWFITRGEEDDAGRQPLKAVYFCHEDWDGFDPRRGWANTREEAKAEIDYRELSNPSSLSILDTENIGC